MSLRFGPPTPDGPNPGHTLVDFGAPAGLANIFTGGGTVEGWFRATSWGDDITTGDGVGTIFGKTTGTTSTTGWRVYILEQVTAMQFRHGRSTQQGRWRTDVGSILLNVWYHFALTYDDSSSGNDAQFYLNGVAVTTTRTQSPSGSVNSDATRRLALGEMYAQETELGFEGYMRQLRIYDKVLDADAISNIFHGKGIDRHNTENLLMWLPLDDESHRRSPDFVATNCLSENNGGSTTVTADLPEDVVDGNQLVMILASSGRTSVSDANENITTPGGWTHINIGETDLAAAGSNPSLWIFRRIASSEPASYVVTGNQSNLKTTFILNLLSTPIVFPTVPDVISTLSTGTNSSPTAPSITPSDDALAIFIALADDDDIVDGGDIRNWPEGVNGRMDYEDSGGANNNGHSLVIATQLVDGGVATGSRLFPLQATEEWGAYSFAFIIGQGLRPEGMVSDYTDNAFPNRLLQHPHVGPTDSSAMSYDEENPDIHNQRTR